MGDKTLDPTLELDFIVCTFILILIFLYTKNLFWNILLLFCAAPFVISPLQDDILMKILIIGVPLFLLNQLGIITVRYFYDTYDIELIL